MLQVATITQGLQSKSCRPVAALRACETLVAPDAVRIRSLALQVALCQTPLHLFQTPFPTLQNINEEALNYELVERLVCHIVEAELAGGPGALLAPGDRQAAERAAAGGGAILIFMTGAMEIDRTVRSRLHGRRCFCSIQLFELKPRISS